MLKLTIKKDDLIRGVGQTSAIAEKRSSMPILSHILVEVEDNKMRLTATDMEISFQGSYPVEMTSPGRLTVPAKKFNEVVRLLSNEQVELSEVDNFVLDLTAGKFNTQMYGLSPDDFPKMAHDENMEFITLDGPSLADVINKTIFSVATEETRYNLAGILMEKVKNQQGEDIVQFVSTDGHRLNIASLSATNIDRLELPKGALLSRKGMHELKRLAESSETVQLGVGANSLVATIEDSILVMRLLDGRFPDYNLAIPKDNDKTITVPRKKMLETLKRISIMRSDEDKGVKFKIEPGQITISAISREVGAAEETMEVEYTGEPLDAGFNPQFFIDALTALRSENIMINCRESTTPAVITAPEDPGYCGVIMAIKSK